MVRGEALSKEYLFTRTSPGELSERCSLGNLSDGGENVDSSSCCCCCCCCLWVVGTCPLTARVTKGGRLLVCQLGR